MRQSVLWLVVAVAGLLAAIGTFIEPTRLRADHGFRLLAADGRPVVTEMEVLAYDWQTHTVYVDSAVANRLWRERVGELVGGSPFMVEAGGEVCYRGAFTTSVSSTSVPSVVILLPYWNIRDGGPVGLVLELGYPSPAFFQGPDPREDPRVRTALARTGKLKSYTAEPAPIPERAGGK